MLKCDSCNHFISDLAGKLQSKLCPTCGDTLVSANKVDMIHRENKDYNYCTNCDSFLHKEHETETCPMCNKYTVKP